MWCKGDIGMFGNQKVLPAARSLRDVEILMKSEHQYIVVLDIHIGHLKNVMDLAKGSNKKIILHMDLIHGIQSDTYGTEYVCQQFKPYGIMSTKTSVLVRAKKNGVYVIQRVFLLDSSSLAKSYALLERTEPDAIEVLPGVIPTVIQEIRQRLEIPILAGGFIRTEKEIVCALDAGASAITTSNNKLWKCKI